MAVLNNPACDFEFHVKIGLFLSIQAIKAGYAVFFTVYLAELAHASREHLTRLFLNQ
jgi:hypothetical protein